MVGEQVGHMPRKRRNLEEEPMPVKELWETYAV